MRLSTSTNFFAHSIDREFISFKESIRRCKAAGFNVIDINFTSAINGETVLVKDNWVELIEDVRNEAEKIGIEFSQSHPVFLSGNIKDYPVEVQENYYELMRRSIIASSILGVKWAILHPVEEKEKTAFDLEANILENIKYHGPVVELAMNNNVGIAFENMIENASNKRRFSSHAGELAALVDAFHTTKVGACWDFGHGNRLYKDQRIALRTLGKRLKATHINDNDGKSDEHMFPFHGNVDWHSIMPVFHEIGYEGDFTFETHKEFYKMPDHLKDQLAKLGFSIGKYCLSLI
ncbi:MAG TPA: sugar phosphate isomerase/epimerase family protein [Candidatus Avamphibacillus sp.]|nr:sugar phosphate isomerase/epimerase family protein [Candidatus Avamphibacillus sp.]